MSEPLSKRHRRGTHRLVTPDVTLARVAPHLARLGITRCADITGLDRIGVPVYTAILPRSRLIQATAGKGLTPLDARVSALMEAIEIAHIEAPPASVWRGSYSTLARESGAAVDPRSIPCLLSERHYDEQLVLAWSEAEELLSGRRVWLPAAACYPCAPSPYLWSTNGLASGNHLVEATLHALYELIERDALAQLNRPPQRARWLEAPIAYVSLETIDDADVTELVERIRRAGLKLVLAWVRSIVPVHTFWALLLDPNPLSFSTLINAGYGTHASPAVAAVRAVAEAAQSRASMIHASREDLTHKQAYTSQAHARRAYDHFDEVIPTLSWQALEDASAASLDADLAQLLAWLSDAGIQAIYRLDLTRAPVDVPIAKLVVPGLLFERQWV